MILVSIAIIWQLTVQAAPPPQNNSADLSRAISFYNANQLQEAVILLAELDKRIGANPPTKTELMTVKIYLALALVGLKENDEAKAQFIELCKLDSSYTPNLKNSLPDAIVLYNEARASCKANPAAPPSSPDPSIAQSIFLQGKQLYEKGKFTDALKYFNVVLAVESTHELSREYSDLARQWLQVLADGAAAGSPAASMDLPPRSPATAPESSAPPPQPPPSCLHGDPLLAMARIKKRVPPQIQPNLRRYIGRGVVVSIQIDEEGNVAVKDVAKVNPFIADAIKSAVEQWKFNPAVIENQARCVETDLPIMVIQP